MYWHLICGRYVDQGQDHDRRSDQVRDDHDDGTRHVPLEDLLVVLLGRLAT